MKHAFKLGRYSDAYPRPLPAIDCTCGWTTGASASWQTAGHRFDLHLEQHKATPSAWVNQHVPAQEQPKVIQNGSLIDERGLVGEDPHRARAARLFRVPYDEVTPEQRRVGKLLNHADFYGYQDCP